MRHQHSICRLRRGRTFLSSPIILTGGFSPGRFFSDTAGPVPAVALSDGVDYVPAEPKYLLGQHFSAIAAAGPITGPILACVMFGWGPALLWIVLGSIFIGGVHDMGSLIASVVTKPAPSPRWSGRTSPGGPI